MRITLTVIDGPHRGQVFTFTEHDTFLVGRSKKATFQLPSKDKHLSRIHFMIELNPPLCRLHDMGARNKTYVNGDRVASRNLRDGDQIKAGRTALQVRIEVPAEEPATVAYQPSEPSQIEGPAEPVQCALAAVHQAAPIPGYELVRELGKGAMGVVYLARREADGALVALKTISPVAEPKPQQIERFLREASILRQLDHPHIVHFYELGEHAGRLFFAMEYVPGNDAAALLKQGGPLPVRPAIRLVCQALLALEYAHGRRFVHRDLKPANLLIRQADGPKTVKVADFGLARVYQASRLSGLTMQGDLGGTIEFLAPEQITNFRDVRPAADQYSAAATLYNLLTNRYVYDLPPNIAAQLAMILRDDPVPIRQRRPELPAALGAVIDRALRREPEDRFPDVAAFHQALQHFGR